MGENGSTSKFKTDGGSQSVEPIEMVGKTHSHGKGGAHSHGEIDPSRLVLTPMRIFKWLRLAKALYTERPDLKTEVKVI